MLYLPWAALCMFVPLCMLCYGLGKQGWSQRWPKGSFSLLCLGSEGSLDCSGTTLHPNVVCEYIFEHCYWAHSHSGRGGEQRASQPRTAGQRDSREKKRGVGVSTVFCILQSGRLVQCSIPVVGEHTVCFPLPLCLGPTRSPPVAPRRESVSRLEATISRFPLRTLSLAANQSRDQPQSISECPGLKAPTEPLGIGARSCSGNPNPSLIIVLAFATRQTGPPDGGLAHEAQKAPDHQPCCPEFSRYHPGLGVDTSPIGDCSGTLQGCGKSSQHCRRGSVSSLNDHPLWASLPLPGRDSCSHGRHAGVASGSSEFGVRRNGFQFWLGKICFCFKTGARVQLVLEHLKAVKGQKL